MLNTTQCSRPPASTTVSPATVVPMPALLRASCLRLQDARGSPRAAPPRRPRCWPAGARPGRRAPRRRSGSPPHRRRAHPCRRRRRTPCPSAISASSLWSRTRPDVRRRPRAHPQRRCRAAPGARRHSPGAADHEGLEHRLEHVVVGVQGGAAHPAGGHDQPARRRRVVAAASTAAARCTSTTGPVLSSHEMLRATHSRPPISTTNDGSTSVPGRLAAVGEARRPGRSRRTRPARCGCARRPPPALRPAPVPRARSRSDPAGTHVPAVGHLDGDRRRRRCRGSREREDGHGRAPLGATDADDRA